MSSSNVLHEIDLRIRTLSTLISDLHRQVERPQLSMGLYVSPTLQACNHFATLLTRGSDSDNKRKGSGRRVVAVAGKLTSQVIQLTALGSLDETDGPPENVEAIAIQNLASYSADVFQSQVIGPSETSLGQLAQRQALDDPVRDDEELHQYGQDLLAAIRDLRASPSTNFDLFRQFVLRSCLAKIGHRLASDKYLLPRPLDEILYGWRLFPNETFMPKQILVPESLRELLVELGAPVIGDWCQWSPETVSRWIEILREMLVLAKTAVRDCRIRTCGDTGRSSIKINDRVVDLADMALSLLMFVVTLPLRDVFDLDSMHVRLSGHDLPSDVYSAPVDDEDAPKLPEENISKSVLRYLDNVVAWHRAAQYVYGGVQKHMGEISLTIVHTSVPVSHHACAPGEPFVERAILKAFANLNIGDLEYRASLTEMIKGKLQARTQFTGTVHCEASLMGLIASSVVDVGLRPDYLTNARTFKGLVTEKGVATISTGMKCCWCCAWLATRLHHSHPEIKFDIPQSHGQMYPWVLPPVGISIEDALALESELEEIWHRVVGEVVQEMHFSNIFSTRLNLSSS